MFAFVVCPIAQAGDGITMHIGSKTQMFYTVVSCASCVFGRLRHQLQRQQVKIFSDMKYLLFHHKRPLHYMIFLHTRIVSEYKVALASYNAWRFGK